MLDDDSDYIRSGVIDSIAEAGGLVVLQLVLRSDGLYDIYHTKRGRFPDVLQSAIPAEAAREFWADALLRMFRQVTEEQDEVPMLVDGRIKSLFPQPDEE